MLFFPFHCTESAFLQQNFLSVRGRQQRIDEWPQSQEALETSGFPLYHLCSTLSKVGHNWGKMAGEGNMLTCLQLCLYESACWVVLVEKDAG